MPKGLSDETKRAEMRQGDDLSEILYREAAEKAVAAVTASEFRHVGDLYNRIKRYKDAEEQSRIYYRFAETAEKKQRRTQLRISAAVLLAVTLIVAVFLLVLPIIKYNDAVALMEDGKYAEAAEAFSEIERYRDSRDLADECSYRNATELLERGELIVAVRGFMRLGSYKDSKTIVREYQLDAIRMAEVYDIVVFAEYVGTPIEWRVIDIDGDIATLIADGTISDYAKYNNHGVEIDWEHSSVRALLNDNFAGNFREDERDRLIETPTPNPDNAEYETEGGADTVDYAFLLSAEEVEEYFPTKELRASEYSGGTSWWLRTPGEDGKKAVYVHMDGTIYLAGTNVDREQIGLRPAIRVNIAP